MKIFYEKTFDTDDKKILRLRRKSYGNFYKVLAGSNLSPDLAVGGFRTSRFPKARFAPPIQFAVGRKPVPTYRKCRESPTHSVVPKTDAVREHSWQLESQT